MRIFEDNTTMEHKGWRHITLQGMQLSRRFRSIDGMYLYGVFELHSTAGLSIEAEIAEPDASAIINFAVIDTAAVEGSLLRHSAFRHDLDFYIFVGISKGKFSELKKHLESMSPVPILCLATSMDGIA